MHRRQGAIAVKLLTQHNIFEYFWDIYSRTKQLEHFEIVAGHPRLRETSSGLTVKRCEGKSISLRQGVTPTRCMGNKRRCRAASRAAVC